MPEELKPVDLTVAEAAKIDPSEIVKGIPEGESEVEAQGYTVPCNQCGNRYWNRKNFRYTMCPICGNITKWW